MTEAGECEVCSTSTEHKCSGCQSTFYCSRDHQKQHWKRHRNQCTPATVKENEKYGRYLEATRSIKAGEIILKEKPLITGPSQVTPPVCLGCYKLLEQDKTFACEKCGWPFCSEACTTNDVHVPECYYTQKRGEKFSISTFGVPHPNYQCLTVLRCLYQRDHNQKLWAKLLALESHDEERKETDKWNNDKKMIANFLWDIFKLKETFNEHEIMKCCGILQMLTAGVNISSSAHISVCYTDPLWGTEARRHHLSDSKFFECSCERCTDVTEFGTMFSAVKCKKKNCKDYLLPETFILPILHKTKSPNPDTKGLDNKLWKCVTCGDEVSDAIIQQLIQDIGRELSIMPKEDPDACERFINHCSTYLHPGHYYMTDASLALAQMIGQQDERGLAAVSDDRLLIKSQLCKKITDLLEVLSPAETRLRGSLMFELHAAVAETGRRKSLTDGPVVLLGYITEGLREWYSHKPGETQKHGCIFTSVLTARVILPRESRKILMESAALLANEPPELPEGRLARQAKFNLIHMEVLIKNLSATLPSPL